MRFRTLVFILFFAGFFTPAVAQDEHPDTVRTGIYITSIHDIDFRQKEYTIIFWLWFTYKNPDFDFARYLEIPQAKTINTLYTAEDTMEDGSMYVLLKLQCVMKDAWKIDNFPFNRQSLRMTIENAQFDNTALVFARDTTGTIADRHALMGYGVDSLKGWHVDPDSVRISIGTKSYETNFGDQSVTEPHMVYSAYRIKIGIKRNAWALFWKIFVGMYIAFLISYISFYIHVDHIDARFGLSVGALFAVVGNKYIIESSLPESTSFTLVDSLHGLTLLFIFAVIASNARVLWRKKKNEIVKANRIDMIHRYILLFAYLAINIFLIADAVE